MRLGEGCASDVACLPRLCMVSGPFLEVLMPSKLPVDFEAEYRGVAPESSFVRRDTGERVEVPPKLKFEFEKFDGDVELVTVSGSQFDKAHGAPDHKTLKRGDRLRLVGTAVLQDRGSDRDSYFRVDAVEKPRGMKAAA